MYFKSDRINTKTTIEHLGRYDTCDGKRRLIKSNVVLKEQKTDMGCEYAGKAFDLIEHFQKNCDSKGLLNEKFFIKRDRVLDICISMRIAMNHNPPQVLIEELWSTLDIELCSFINFCIGRLEQSLEVKGRHFLEKALSQNKSKILGGLLAEDFKMADKPISIRNDAEGNNDKEKLIDYLNRRKLKYPQKIEIIDNAVNVENNIALYHCEVGDAKGSRSECIILRFNGNHNIVEQVYFNATGNIPAHQILVKYLNSLKKGGKKSDLG